MIYIVCGQFNEFISRRLLSACLQELAGLGIKKARVSTVWVPGSFEMPLMALTLAKKKNVAAVICLGAVIRGDTYHFEVVANEVARGLMDVSLSTGKPVIMGVLTADTIAQAQARAQEKPNRDNKGRDCAKAAVEMINLLRKV